MVHLYNCRHDGDQYRISKLDDDLNIESSYLVTIDACDCPAGPRDTCRHRQMLPKFQAHAHIGDGWFYDYDRGGWVDMRHRLGLVPGERELSREGAPPLSEAANALPESVFDRRGF